MHRGLLLIFLIFSIFSFAQNSRRKTNKSVAYYDNYQRVSVGIHAIHSAEIKGGVLWVWGKNTYGQLGLGDKKERTYHVKMTSDSNWVNVCVGSAHTIGLKSDGTLWAWGRNVFGQLGDGTKTDRLTPIQIGTDNQWMAISAGDSYTLAIKSDGTLWAWGSNAFRQLGDGTTTSRTSPVKIGTDSTWVKVYAGISHSFGLKSNGSIWGWGSNADGQIGDKTNIDRASPVKVGLETNWISLSVGSFHTLGLKSNGTLWAWGFNGEGVLGDSSDISKNRPIQVGSDNNWIFGCAGPAANYAIKSDGTLWTWGSNNTGQLGVGDSITRWVPTKVGKDSNWVRMVGGWNFAIGLQSNGNLYATGINAYYQYSDSIFIKRNAFTPISPSQDIWLTVDAGKYHSIGLKSNGKLYAWGYNNYGELGIGSTTNVNSPKVIGKETNWKGVAAGDYHNLAIKSDGTIWAWGNNSSGELGDGTYTQKTEPQQVGTGRDWKEIAAGANHSLFLKANGTIWVCGKNDKGQLGDGTTNDRNQLVKISSDTDWVCIATGAEYSLGIKSNGTLWAWGYNANGQLGIGTSSNQLTPKQVTGGNWVAIVAGMHSLGLKSNGTLFSWGLGGNGQLGDGSKKDLSIPQQVGSDKSWMAISAGEKHSLGIKMDGNIYSWGLNSKGQLSNGTSNDVSTPAQIGSELWVQINAGADITVGLKVKRDMYCASGGNAFGQLGDGANTDRNLFNCTSNISCVPQAPSNTTQSANQVICYGTSAVLSAKGKGKLGWYTAAKGGTYLGSDTVFKTPKLFKDITYYVQDSTCEASASRTAIDVKVLAPLKLTSKLVDTALCYGSEISLKATATGGKASQYTFNWRIDGTLVSTSDIFNLKTADYFTNTSSTKQLKVTISDNCSSGNDSIKVNLTSMVKPVAAFNFDNACSGKNTSLTYTGTKPMDSIIWNMNGEQLLHSENPKYVFMNAGKKAVTLMVSKGSCRDTVLKEVVVNVSPVAKFTVNDVCAYDSAAFINQSQNAKTYQWRFGDSSIATKVNTKHLYKPKFTNQSYMVWLTAKESSGCVDSTSNIITVYMPPVSEFDMVINTNSLEFIAKQTTNPYYKWVFNQKDSIVGPSKASHIKAHGLEVCLNVKSTFGCVSTTCKKFTLAINKLLSENIKVYPNPNNGRFTIETASLSNETPLKIYNDLGQIVFERMVVGPQSLEVELMPGIYFMKIGEFECQRIVIE